MHEKPIPSDWGGRQLGTYIGDVSGCTLDVEKVKVARVEELAQIDRFREYKEGKTDDCIQAAGCPPLGARWLDRNK